jgi:hypothetical protein
VLTYPPTGLSSGSYFLPPHDSNIDRLPRNQHTLLFRTPKMGNDYISVATFRQMCGRAGRMGLDTTGEAILMVCLRFLVVLSFCFCNRYIVVFICSMSYGINLKVLFKWNLIFPPFSERTLDICFKGPFSKYCLTSLETYSFSPFRKRNGGREKMKIPLPIFSGLPTNTCFKTNIVFFYSLL